MREDSKTHWEEIHQTRLTDVSWWQDANEVWLDLFDFVDVKPQDQIIDVGAGASVLVDELLRSGFQNVTVLDLSESALARARERLGKAPSVNFVCADVLKFRSEVPFHIWHDRAVFHFLITEIDQGKYLESLCANLRSGGYAIIQTFALDGPEECSGLSVVRHDQQSLEKIFGLEFELVFSERREHVTPWKSVQPFTVVIFKRR